MFKYEKIVNRKKELFAYEVLIQDAYRLDWVNITDDLLNNLTLTQVDAVLNLSKLSKKLILCNKYFINVERKQLLDSYFIEKIAEKCNFALQNGIEIYLEITERDAENNSVTSEYLSHVKNRHGLRFIADDVSIDDVRWEEIESGIYDFVKIEELPKKVTFSGFIDSLLLKSNKSNCQFIIEKIETSSAFDLAMLFPFCYFQGYLFN